MLLKVFNIEILLHLLHWHSGATVPWFLKALMNFLVHFILNITNFNRQS